MWSLWLLPFLLVLPLGAQLAEAQGRAATAAADSGASLGGEISFWALAVLVILGALATVMQRNTVTAVMSLVATFFGLAGLYLILSAQFLAALQVLVYAGAIMTLFVFVVMVLNREEAEPFLWRGWLTKTLGVGAALYLAFQIIKFVGGGSRAAKADLPPAGFGGVADVGALLFTRYLLPFEALSLMLLVAVIGAVVVARTPRHHEDHSGGLSHRPLTDEDEGDPARQPNPAQGH